MKRTLISILGLSLALLAGGLWADASSDAVRAKLAKVLGVEPGQIHVSTVAAGLYEVQHNHDIFYATTDGKYAFKGDLINIDTGEQITEGRRRADRLAALKELGDNNMIEFAPQPPIAAKYLVTVFTDFDCPYCRKLHSEMADYNAKGIAIRYAFFPRSGLDTPSFFKAESVWCAADQHAAFTRAKRGDEIPARRCDNPVGREYQLGLDLGIRGTPMLILPNGDIYPGYLDPEELAMVLNKADSEAKQASAPPKPNS